MHRSASTARVGRIARVYPVDGSSQPARLMSLDAFRGATIAAMILVNNPGSWAHVYAPLRHADWHGCTPTDLIFPFFLFIVGTSMAFSMRGYLSGDRPRSSAYARIARRVAALFALGLVLSGVLWNDWSVLRIPGVLQRIALVYLLASVLVLNARPAVQGVVAVVALLGYWLLLTRVPGPDGSWGLGAESNIVRAADLALIGEAHLYSNSPTDPEGLLSTLPAVVTTLLGYWSGLALRTHRNGAVPRLLVAGAIGVVAGLVWGAGRVPAQQAAVDKFVRAVHRRARDERTRGLLLGDRRARMEAVREAVRDLWRQRDLRVRRVGAGRPADLCREVRRCAREGLDRRANVRTLARPGECIARVRGEHRPDLVVRARADG